MRRRKKNRTYIVALGLVAVAALAVSAWYYRGGQLSGATATEPAMRTARARLGDMRISLTGAGSLVAGAEMDIGFETSGRVTEVLVQLGDRVEAGQILARLDRADAEAQVTQAELGLRLAELKLAQLEEGPDADEVATAQANLATAQENLASLQAGPGEEELATARASLAAAEEKYRELLAGPSEEKALSARASLENARLSLQQAQIEYAEAAQDPEKSAAARAAYDRALREYEVAQASYDATMKGASQSELQSALAQVTQARNNLEKLLAGPTAAELASAEAQVASAQAKLDALLAGPTDLERESAALEVEKARFSLEQAQRQLEATELKAPIAGTITALDLTVGQTVGTGAVISLADLDHVLVRFYIDETEISLLALGQEVRVTFDALPGQNFTGQVTRIEPGLRTVSGVPVVTAWASLEVPEGSQAKFMGDMNAAVEVIAAERQGVVLVPMEAVREMGAGQYAVFVVGQDGELELRPVQVGLSDNLYYEVVSGLEPGEVVTTGTVDTGV
ncbi:MAG: efflux RND transporter periplasmic adaptor subunit [Anaerolineae bacterium]|nr:efflux RND transporter periplasmic adaptor subunit [Anaerolineae bacterium]